MRKGHWPWEERRQIGAESVSDIFRTIIEIAGDQRILIENHCGVVTYGKEMIVVKVKYGSVSIAGSGLDIANMTKEQLVIFGTIQSITLHRREKLE